MRVGLIFNALRQPMLSALGCLLVLSPLPAYYPFLHLRHDGDVIRSIPERFDLRTLPDSSVPFVVSKTVEPEFAPITVRIPVAVPCFSALASCLVRWWACA